MILVLDSVRVIITYIVYYMHAYGNHTCRFTFRKCTYHLVGCLIWLILYYSGILSRISDIQQLQLMRTSYSSSSCMYQYNYSILCTIILHALRNTAGSCLRSQESLIIGLACINSYSVTMLIFYLVDLCGCIIAL